MSESNEIQLTEAQIDDLQVSFAAMNPIEFARHLNSQTCIAIPDCVKSELLRAKVNQKPVERDDAMRNVISRAMETFWNRLENSAGDVS